MYNSNNGDKMMDENGNKIYLFVWEKVLTDYTNGIAFALAHDLEEALTLFKKKCSYDLELPISKMRKIENPEAFFVYGGG